MLKGKKNETRQTEHQANRAEMYQQCHLDEVVRKSRIEVRSQIGTQKKLKADRASDKKESREKSRSRLLDESRKMNAGRKSKKLKSR